jgi:hypothetical protein
MFSSQWTTALRAEPTSPGIARTPAPINRRLGRVRQKARAELLRYADDLSFSSRWIAPVDKFRSIVSRIVSEEGFVINVKKTRLWVKAIAKP